MTIRRVLLALSGTKYSEVALIYALELAHRHNAELTGVTVIDIEALSRVGPVPVGAGPAASDLVHYRQAVTRERVEEVIAMFKRSCREADVVHRVAREEGNPFAKLIELWRYHDLTILALRGLFEYGLDKHPEDYLIQIIQGGVRPILAISETYREIRRVLIAYNGSVESANAMKAFVRTHTWPVERLKIVCFGKRVKEPQKLLDDAAAYCRVHAYEVETEHVMGARARELLLAQAVEWNADMIVMGATRRVRVFRKVLGDTALRAICDAEIPLYLTQ